MQPVAEDLHWVQIEDFVELFSRLYVVADLSFDKKAVTKYYSSRWLPGDYLVGGGGPPIVVTSEVEEVEDEEDAPADGPKKTVTRRTASINDNFTDNPMYPFSVSEPCTLCVSLYQADKRWNVGRLGEDPQEVLVAPFTSRADRLRACMEYPVGIGFLVMKLSGLKHRVTEFKLRKVVHSSDGVQFSNIVSNVVNLRPGRYAIVPFTHVELSRSLDYVLHAQYLSSQVDFEVEDVIAQRLSDPEPSEDGAEGEDDQDDNDLLRVGPGEDDQVSVMSFERVRVAEDEDVDEEDDAPGPLLSEKVPPPRLKIFKQWEYSEDTEELGVAQVFAEVGDLMKYMKALRGEVRKLHGTMRAVSAINQGEGVQEEKKDRKNLVASGKRY